MRIELLFDGRLSHSCGLTLHIPKSRFFELCPIDRLRPGRRPLHLSCHYTTNLNTFITLNNNSHHQSRTSQLFRFSNNSPLSDKALLTRPDCTIQRCLRPPCGFVHVNVSPLLVLLVSAAGNGHGENGGKTQKDKVKRPNSLNETKHLTP